MKTDSAEQAIRALNDAGFDMKKLSLVGKGCHSEEQPMGFCTSGDRIKTWGGRGASSIPVIGNALRLRSIWV